MKTSLKKRLLLILLALAIQAIYTPTSLFLTGGIEPKLPVDIFPLWVVWVVPYVLCYPLWAVAIGWLVAQADDHRFRAAIAGLIFTVSLGIAVFILFPTYVVPVPLTGADLFTRLLLSLQTAGGDHDALPSAHIYATTFFALLYREWYPRHTWTWILVLAVVSLSTLFTKQHYVADVLAGWLTGWLGYRFGLWWNTIGEKAGQRKTSHA